HRRAGVDEAADAARYAALSLLMTQPPGFSIYLQHDQTLPADLEPLLDFVPLLREFYISSGIKNLIPKYIGIADTYAAAYRQPVGGLIYQTLEYFHTNPETIINMRPFVVAPGGTDAKSQKSAPKV